MRQILADYPTLLPFVFGVVVGNVSALFMLALLHANPRDDDPGAAQSNARDASKLPSDQAHLPGHR